MREYKKSLERGKEEVPKEYKDRLVENNIARVKQLAGRAANNPNFSEKELLMILGYQDIKKN